jgi:hypothetical protein
MTPTITKMYLYSAMRGVLLVMLALLMSNSVEAQTATPIERKDVLNATPSDQRKYAINMPANYVVIDLVNYPTGRDEDKYKDESKEYLTVDQFYNAFTPYQRLQVLLNPDTYYVALNASDFPTMTIGQ